MGSGTITSLLILGMILIFLEIFVPGGFLGFAGIVLLATGIFMTAETPIQGVIYVSIMILTLALLFALSFRFPKTKQLWQRFALTTRQKNIEGYVAPSKKLDSYLGQQGVAISQLRPSGTADFMGVRLDVVSEGQFVAKGSPVKVIAVEGTRVIVREVSGQPYNVPKSNEQSQ